MEFVKNVHSEQMRARNLENPGHPLDKHAQKLMDIEREIIKEHVRHFLDKVESFISIAQW